MKENAINNERKCNITQTNNGNNKHGKKEISTELKQGKKAWWNMTQLSDRTKFLQFKGLVLLMMFNATFNTISAILLWSVLLVEESRVHGENHSPVVSQ